MAAIKSFVRWFFLLSTPLFPAFAYAVCNVAPSAIERDDVLVVVNDNSISSPQVGDYYCEQRKLNPANIAHVRVPPDFFTSLDQFFLLRDQIIKFMQENTIGGVAPAQCGTASGETKYYCADSVRQLRELSKIRYIVLTKGVPTRFDYFASPSDQPTSIDTYLRGWLANFYAQDSTLVLLERARAFGDGRGQRLVNPATDKEFIVGRVDGLTVEAAKAMVDRTLAAERNGIFGKLYSSRFGHVAKYARDDTGARVKQWITSGSPVPLYPSWRYLHGLFGEVTGISEPALRHTQQAECYGPNRADIPPPQECVTRIVTANEGPDLGLLGDGSAAFVPRVDNALMYLGYLDGHRTVGPFENLLNWRESQSCSALCADAADVNTCKAMSVDVFKEIDTRCVNVAEGFIGYNMQSYPVGLLAAWPTAWGMVGEGGDWGGNGGTAIKKWPAEVRNEPGIGFDDDFSLWFRNTDVADSEACYANSDELMQSPASPCIREKAILFGQIVSLPSVRTVSAQPQQLAVRFRYRALNLSRGGQIKVQLFVHEQPADLTGDGDTNDPGDIQYENQVGYDQIAVNLSPGSTPSDGVSWSDEVVVNFVLDAAKHRHPQKLFDAYKIRVTTNLLAGEIAFDNFSLKEDGVDIPLTNPSFVDGHRWLSDGSSAATFLSRLNGVAFWGSVSHHLGNGHSFDTHPFETLVYFMRGLPLGDAVWFAEEYNSGVFYGDPLYSPLAVRLDFPPNKYDFVTGSHPLVGDAVNGQSTSTTYTVDYCAGTDFFVCDQAGSWMSVTAGAGGSRKQSFGVWDTSPVSPGAYVLRLSVTSSNGSKTQTFYDYRTMRVYNSVSDYDGDGLTDVEELNSQPATDPTNPDSDGDELTDGEEVNDYGTNPTLKDTDGDRMPDNWEVYNGTDPLRDDARDDPDADGVANIVENLRGTSPVDRLSVPPLKTIYVDGSKTGGDGSESNPFTTIHQALWASDSGDTIKIMDGVYTAPFENYSVFKAVRIVGSKHKKVVWQGVILNIVAEWGEVDGVVFDFAESPNQPARKSVNFGDGVFTVANSGFSRKVTLTVGKNTIFENVKPVNENSYYVLNPAQQLAPLSVMSLESNNVVQAGATTLTLNNNEIGVIPVVDLTVGSNITGSAPFSTMNNQNGTDANVPESFVGTSFVLPHARGDFSISIFSPYGDATVTIDRDGSSPRTESVIKDQLLEITLGSSSIGSSVVINADIPILILHRSLEGGVGNDVYPVPPAALEIFGIESADVYIGAMENDTRVTVYSSGGGRQSLLMQAGQQTRLPAILPAPQGEGGGIRLVANHPISAVQLDDGDGVESTAFLERKYLNVQYGISAPTQYVAVLCPNAGTTVMLMNQNAVVESRDCGGDGVEPGKLYFGSNQNGSHIGAGYQLQASQPVYAITENSVTDDEQNIFGRFSGGAKTVYEDAEDLQADGWVIYGGNTTGASVTNVLDAQKNSNVIQLSGSGDQTGYRLGDSVKTYPNAWHNSAQKTFDWDFKYSEPAIFYVAVETTQGFRYLYYSFSDTDQGIAAGGTYIHHGLGSALQDGAWHTVSRDLEADLREFEPDNRLVEVNAFLVRGSGFVDNILLRFTDPIKTVYEDAEDLKADRWVIYGGATAGATVTNLLDIESNSNVIQLSGNGDLTGYRLGDSNSASSKAWHNATQKTINWEFKYSEPAVFYVAMETAQGFRYLYYTFSDADQGISASGTYIHRGLGSMPMDGAWHAVSRDLEADLRRFEPDNQVIEVNAFLVRGSGFVDNILLH